MNDVRINEHGNNSDIKVHLADGWFMKELGFRWVDSLNEWYFCKPVFRNDITFNFSVKSEDDWRIDVLDESFCQPYDYQWMLSNNIKVSTAQVVKKNVDEIMDSFVKKGFISDWKVGDYI